MLLELFSNDKDRCNSYIGSAFTFTSTFIPGASNSTLSLSENNNESDLSLSLIEDKS